MSLVTVFGGSGFIGRHLVQRLAASGASVRVAVRDPIAANFLKTMGDVGQVTPIYVDVHNDASVANALTGSHAVVNLIGILYERGTQQFDTIHCDGAARIAREAKSAGVERLIHMSALGASTTSPSRYAWSKAAGEIAVREAFPESVIFRPSVVFGPHDEFFNLFAALARLSPVLPVFGCPLPTFKDGAVDIYGDGGVKFQPVYAGDVADALMKCVTDSATTGQTYELGGPVIYSFKALMELILEATDRKCLLAPTPYFVASLQAFFLQFMPKPLLTPDQVTLLRSDNVVSGSTPTLADLGVNATAAEVILPTYLDKFRRGGRFHKTQAV
jgi:uncharacterized protein YbjT (DUF2867 family)